MLYFNSKITFGRKPVYPTNGNTPPPHLVGSCDVATETPTFEDDASLRAKSCRLTRLFRQLQHVVVLHLKEAHQ